MSKAKVVFVCQSCGTTSARWLGRCPGCEAWNTLVEERATKSGAAESKARAVETVLLSDAPAQAEHKDHRTSTKISELDRVLGGGLVEGSVVLLGGEPGMGKSTLLLQALANISGPTLYVSGEESVEQVAGRARRLGVASDRLRILCSNTLQEALDALHTQKPKVAVIDSLQTLADDALESAPGSVSQVREVGHRLARIAKSDGLALFLVGHVNKDGALAGPKVVEHLVDVVLYFDSEAGDGLRILRAHKNRFGAVSEVGIFEMAESGLIPVTNPSERFLSERSAQQPGSVITAQLNGTRPILAEVQALCVPTPFGMPRRTALGVDPNRVALLLAVLERCAGMDVLGQDVFVNAAGGLRLTEPSSDVAIALAVASSVRRRAVDAKVCAIGEVGLTGEIRRVARVEQRVEEARRLGFTRVLVPEGNAARLDSKGVVPVGTLKQALMAAGLE
ncbi:MAG: DNA repair protein RadA [Deltaproteobacteria bacterium]|nr:DNA repair protein RadA [Deltaproteobacteria bacterium]